LQNLAGKVEVHTPILIDHGGYLLQISHPITVKWYKIGQR